MLKHKLTQMLKHRFEIFLMIAIFLIGVSSGLLYREISSGDRVTPIMKVDTLVDSSLLAYVDVLEMDNFNLNRALDISRAKVKDLEKRVGKVKYITKVDTRVEVDTIRIPVYKDTITKFDYKDKWMEMSGRIKDSLDFNLKMDVPLIVGKGDKSFINTPNPYVRFTNMISLEKQKKWSIGFYGGFGVTYGIKGFDVGPQIGVGISYKI